MSNDDYNYGPLEHELGGGACADNLSPEQPALTEAEAQLVIGAIPLQALPEQPAREADDHELRKQALIATAEFIADDRRWQELRDGGAICKSHELAVLVTHINDGEPCSDYLHDAPAARKAGVE